LRLRRQPQAKEFIQKSELLLTRPQDFIGRWSSIYPVGPIYLEIGMGKGRFITDCALRFPENNYLGLELREEMIMTAIGRLQGQVPHNLRFLWLNARLLPDIFAQGEINGIYLNFSDPWPKKRHAKRRLTHPNFLHIYEHILHPDGQIFFKTDNQDFYYWSLDSFSDNNWKIIEKSKDWPLCEGDVMTEYEQRYRQKGQPIYFCRLANPDK
jgi:tRNA (guanine-N7-)-methyltransferase